MLKNIRQKSVDMGIYLKKMGPDDYTGSLHRGAKWALAEKKES